MNSATRIPAAATVDLKLEVVVLPVADVDRAKRFYEGLGWRLDADFAAGRTGGWSSSHRPDHRARSTSARESRRQRRARLRNLYLVVSDIEAARDELIGRGADVSEVFHFAGLRGTTRAGPRPERHLLRNICLVQRSRRQQLAAAGDQDAAARTRAQQPGRRDSDRTSARDREAPWRVRTDGSEAPLVGLVRRLHRRARAGMTPEDAAKSAAQATWQPCIHDERLRGGNTKVS